VPVDDDTWFSWFYHTPCLAFYTIYLAFYGSRLPFLVSRGDASFIHGSLVYQFGGPRMHFAHTHHLVTRMA
jgi:hypothetical protein